MADPFSAISPTKTLYDMLTSRHGLTAFAVAGVQTGMFLTVVWVGGWTFNREWGTVAMWLVFLVCSVALLIAWAYHVYRDAEDRRERAATVEIHKLSQDVLAARREAFDSDEAFYKARKDWARERDTLAKQIEDTSRRHAEQQQTIVAMQQKYAEALQQVADLERRSLRAERRLAAAEQWLEEHGKRVVSLGSEIGHAEVQAKP